MKKYIKNIILSSLSIGLLVSVVSCSESLDIVPTDRVSDSSILTDSSLFESFVINRYMGARLTDKEAEGTPPGFGRGFEYAMWATLTDEAIYNNDDNTWLVQRGQLAPENTGIAGTIWGRSYRSIREINYALTNVANVKMSTSQKNRLTGELKFLRAFRYQDLIRNYGSIILLKDKVYNLGDDFTNADVYTKSSIQECVNYAVTELDEASKLLPADNSSSWQLGRATKGAALALKSRLLLYAASPLYSAGTWQAAATAAKDVMNMGKYSLFTNGYDKLFLTPENNPEIIFERLYTRGARHVCLEISNAPNGYDGWGGNLPLQNMVDAYETNKGKTITDPASGYNPQAPYENRDPRFYMTILYNGANYRNNTIQSFLPGGKDSKDGPSNWNTSKTGYYLKKFMNDNLPINNPWDVSGTQPWIYFRYAEILLNYAEAQNEAAGPDQTVYDAVNAVRSRKGVGMPALASGLTKEQMRDAIRRERQVELAFEEHRFYDVRRWKIANVTENVPAYGIDVTKNGNTFTYTRKEALSGRRFEDKHYFLPIPRAEIQAANGKLTQNSGY